MVFQLRRFRGFVLPALLAVLALSGCSRSPEEKAAAFVRKGNTLLEKKDYARAILEYRNAAQVLPKSAEPYYRLGLAYLATGDHRMAVSHIIKAAELDPKHVAAQLKLAEMMATSRTKETLVEAQKRARQVLAVSPGNAQALDALALADIHLGDSEAAEKHLREALANFPRHLRSSVALAQVKLAQKDYQESEKVLKEAVAQAPGSADPLVALGEFYLMLRNTGEADRHFRRALALDPNHAMALIDLARLETSAGRLDEAGQLYQRLSALPVKRLKPLHALFLIETGRKQEGVAELERLSQADPADRDVRTRLVGAYLATNRNADAERILAEALRKNRKDTDALYLRSRMYLAAGNASAAQADLTQVLSFRPDSAEAHYLMAKVHQARRSEQNRKQELNEALRVDPFHLLARLELADVLLSSRAGRAALDLLNAAPARQRNTLPLMLKRNWALMACGEKQELQGGIAAVLAIRRVPEALVQDAMLKLSQGNYAGARTPAEEALRYEPDNARALETIASSYILAKQYPAAIERVRRQAVLRPASVRIQQLFAELLAASGDRAAARAQLEKVRTLDRDYAPAALMLAQLDIDDGKLDAARSTLTGIAAANPHSVPAQLALGAVGEKSGDYAAAIVHYRLALEADPRNIAAMNNLAYILVEHAGQPAEALKYAQQAKELAPESPAVDDTLGWAYYRNGVYASAVKHLENAVSRQGTARRKYHLAMAYVKAGDRERGRKTLKEALIQDARLPEAQAARQVLDERVAQGR